MRTVISIVFLLILGPVLAQDKPLNTQTVTVTRSYSPSIAPASKILTEPGLSDSLFLKKRPVQWSRFTAPVASTFSPAKGKAEKVQPEPPEKLYNTAVSLAAGNFTNIEAEAFTRQPLGTGRNSYALGLEHRSAQGDILDNPLPTSFSQTALEGGLHFKGKENTGHLLMEIQRDIYHWYGFDRDLFGPESFPESGVQQRYFTGALNGQYTDDKVAVDGGFRWFIDETGSDESRLQFGSRFDVEIDETRVSFLPSIDWVQGQQSVTSLREVAAASPDRYSQAQAEIAVHWSIKKKEWDLQIGGAVVYNVDALDRDQGFSVYPRVKARYPLQKEKHYFVGEATGGLKQNSYAQAVAANPFVAPSLDIRPNQQQYLVKGGLQGLIATNVTYQIGVAVESNDQQALFQLNPYNTFRTDEAYAFGNSFEWLYEDVQRYGGYFALQWEPKEAISFRTSWQFDQYSTASDNPAWNLPNYQGEVALSLEFMENWRLTSELYVIGEREDLSAIQVGATVPIPGQGEPFQLEPILDLNLGVEYQWTPQWSFFLQGRNLSNQNYTFFAQYPAQGAQLLGGARYRFDW